MFDMPRVSRLSPANTPVDHEEQLEQATLISPIALGLVHVAMKYVIFEF